MVWIAQEAPGSVWISPICADHREAVQREQVGATGLEPPRFPCGKQGGPSEGGAQSGALPGDSAPKPAPATPPTPPADPDLGAVVAAWPALPPALRAGIVAMVKAARGGQ